MKQLILNSTFLLLIFISACTYSQNISTEGVQWCTWDNDLELWRDCTVDYNKPSLIIINKDQTVITQTTEDNRSTYYINTREVLTNDKQEKIWRYDINSDLGQSYTLFINPITKTVRAVYIRDGVTQGTTFYIKAIY
jgi:hypothetical protein